ncbi:protein METABOLIC NETWORK MODULATOR 1-like isoform X1 [Actinidia eriantha]|uniref:protein METABOLIC NETWORK MODULATOR 1-like isoform X1 n=1 Tax=Actinidia eriantha TaxID=165200 RepID=UPI002587A425|nr:protein METABOLIC NETWORK MODULATOR 1-like isoform X1 [Actinidia eriantha]XP_057464740.1 protein METABOLIC NETWORK MODULATOR 1-like isoform X1 [Actinidia eriantha]
MNQVNQENNNGAPLNMPVKRKRGRPRKDQSLPRRETAPPGFGVVKGNQPRQILAIEDASASIVGQPVTGIVEAVFDAGYLLAVKIGNSNMSLRGVVFKPGHYVPISSQNDVAPHVQMIRRNEIPFPRENQTRGRGRGRRPRSKDRNGQHGNLRSIETGHLVNGYPATNLVHGLVPQTADHAASKAYPIPYVGSRGTVVPVVLQPVTMLSGFPPANQMPPILSQAGHMVVSNHKPLHIITSQVGPSQPQTSHQVTPEGVKSDPTQEDVNKRVQIPSQSSETQIDNSMGGGKLSEEDSGNSMEGDSDDMSEPLSVEPLQTIHTNIHNQSGPFTNPSANNRIGRMSELLQALQENMTDPRAPS